MRAQSWPAPLPAIVTAELLGVPTSDAEQLKDWSADFAEVLGNFQHNPDRTARTLRCVEEMSAYFRDAIQRMKKLDPTVPVVACSGYPHGDRVGTSIPECEAFLSKPFHRAELAAALERATAGKD